MTTATPSLPSPGHQPSAVGEASHDSSRLSDQIQKFVRLSSSFAALRQSQTESIFARSEIVYDVSQWANKKEIAEFRRQCRLRKKATFSQFKTIGAAVGWLRKYAAIIPAKWRTLYEIARLGESRTESLAAAGVLTTAMTREQLTAALRREAEATPDPAPSATDKDEPRFTYVFVFTADQPLPAEMLDSWEEKSRTLAKRFGICEVMLRDRKGVQRRTAEYYAAARAEDHLIFHENNDNDVDWLAAAEEAVKTRTIAFERDFPDYELLEGQYWGALLKRCEDAVKQLVRREWNRRLRVARAQIRGSYFATTKDRARAAERLIGFTREDVFGGHPDDGLYAATTPDAVSRLVAMYEYSARSGGEFNPNADGPSLLYRAVVVLGISESAIASAIQHAQQVRGSLRYQKATKALQPVIEAQQAVERLRPLPPSSVAVDRAEHYRNRYRRDFSSIRT